MFLARPKVFESKHGVFELRSHKKTFHSLILRANERSEDSSIGLDDLIFQILFRKIVHAQKLNFCGLNFDFFIVSFIFSLIFYIARPLF